MEYNENKAFELYQYFLAVKRHLTSDSYDIVKYHGKVNASKTSLNKRKDKFAFFRMTTLDHPKEQILANLLKNPKIWAGDISSKTGGDIWKAWDKNNQSITYIFRQELSKLDDDITNELNILEEHEYPKIIKRFLAEEISINTLIILDDLLGVFNVWAKSFIDDPVLESINTQCNKQKVFLHYERNKMKDALKLKYTPQMAHKTEVI